MIPTIETERLRLRAPRMEDFAAYAAFRGSQRARILGGPFSEAVAFEQLAAILGHWHLRGFGRFMVAERASDAPLGIVGPFYPFDWPEPEIAWSVFEEAEGKGIAYEAAYAARAFAYETLGWETAISCVAPDNTRSIRLAERLGATFERALDIPDLGDLHIYRHPAPEVLQ